MANTTHYNLPQIPTGAVNWVALVNDIVTKLEKGRTLKRNAGEAITVRKAFYTKSTDGKAYKASPTTEIHGIWQSTSTAINTDGFGQVGGIMTYGSWTWTPGAFLFVNATADLVATPPTWDSRPVAYAISATEILLIPPKKPVESGMVHVNNAAAGTTAVTSEEDLMSFTLPANTLDVDGKGVRIKAWGTTGANGNTKTIRMKFGATTILTEGPTAHNNKVWILEGTAYRTGASAQDAHGLRTVSGVAPEGQITTPAENTAANIVIKVTGQNGTAAANDIVCEGLMIEKL